MDGIGWVVIAVMYCIIGFVMYGKEMFYWYYWFFNDRFMRKYYGDIKDYEREIEQNEYFLSISLAVFWIIFVIIGYDNYRNTKATGLMWSKKHVYFD